MCNIQTRRRGHCKSLPYTGNFRGCNFLFCYFDNTCIQVYHMTSRLRKNAQSAVLVYNIVMVTKMFY